MSPQFIAARIIVASLCGTVLAFGQATMKQLMLDLIHPAANEILLIVDRGGPTDEAEWAAVRRNALTLSESGSLLTMPARNPNQPGWAKDAAALSDVGNALYKAAQARDPKALAALTAPLDASCTTCHKQYRPDVFPAQKGSQ
jgi:cytochrome c556